MTCNFHPMAPIFPATLLAIFRPLFRTSFLFRYSMMVIFSAIFPVWNYSTMSSTKSFRFQPFSSLENSAFFRHTQWMVGHPTERGIVTLPVPINLQSYSLPSNWHHPFKLPPYQSQPTPSVSSQVRPSVKSFLTLASETSESSLHLLLAPPLVPLPDSFHLFHLFQLPHLPDPEACSTCQFRKLYNISKNLPQFHTTLEFIPTPLWNSILHHSEFQICTLEFNSNSNLKSI